MIDLLAAPDVLQNSGLLVFRRSGGIRMVIGLPIASSAV